MRDLLLLVTVFSSLPAILMQPFFGLLVYSWIAYMRPHDMVWGEVPQLSLFVALTLLAGLVLAIGRENWLCLRVQTVLLIALGVWVGLSGFLAVDPHLAREWTVRIGKLLLIAVLTTGLVQTAFRFRLLYLVIAGSLGLLGVKYGLYSLVRGGVRIAEGVGSFPDNNGLALALCMALPLLVGLVLTERHIWIRIGATVAAVLTTVAIVSTFSRGGLISLAVVAGILLVRSGRPIAVMVAAVLTLAGVLLITSADFQESYVERASSISEYQEDESALGRFREWGTAVRVFADHPLLGVGPDNLRSVRPFYVLDGSPFKTTHNSYLQILVASGLPALVFLVGALALSVFQLEKLRRNSPSHWVRVYASMIQCSLVAYMIGGMLVDGAYFDLTYHLVAMSVSLELAAKVDIADTLNLEPMDSARAREWWLEAPASSQSMH